MENIKPRENPPQRPKDAGDTLAILSLVIVVVIAILLAKAAGILPTW